MIIAGLVSFLLPMLTGFMLVGLLWSGSKSSCTRLLIRFTLALPLGLGIHSCLFFLFLVAGGKSVATYAVAEISFALILIALAFAWVKRPVWTGTAGRPFPSDRATHSSWLFYAAFSAVIGLAVVAFITRALDNPHGGRDALQIWNLRARFIFRGLDHWHDSFSPLLFNANYPLLIPASIARVWLYLGQDRLLVPSVIGCVFTFATVGLLCSSVAELWAWRSGLMAGMVLLSISHFVEDGTAQEADVPIGFLILATVIMLSLHDRSDGQDRRCLVLAGIMAGLAAWTKNEGLLFCLTVVIARFVIVFTANGSRSLWKEMTGLMLGMLPILLIVFYFKLEVAPNIVPTTVVNPSEGINTVLERLTDLTRYRMLIRGFAWTILHYTNWMVDLGILVSFGLLLTTVRIEPRNRRSLATLLTILVLMVAGDSLAILITPLPMQWHLRGSLNRLLLQLWPATIFSLFLLVARSNEAGQSAGIAAG